MNDKLKAVVAAAVPLVAAIALAIATGEVNEEEIAVGVTGLLTAVLVWLAPNTPRPERRRPNIRVGEHR
jgi:hypothetical protein